MAATVDIRARYDRLTAQAKTLANRDGETRTMDQLRSDIAGDLLITGDATLLPAAARGIRATVSVTVPALALLHGDTTAHGVATVEGVGPIPIDTARELAGSAKSWMRVLTHPETGSVLSIGRKKYRPPADLRRAARWRPDTCVGPGCGMPASRCTSTTTSHGSTAARPRSGTTLPSAKATTPSDTAPNGTSNNSPTAAE